MKTVFVMLALLPQLAVAQIDAASAKRIAENAARTVEENYVFPDTGRMVAEYIRGRVRAGAYDAPMDAGRLADHLTADMKSVNGDLHLYAQYSARPEGAMGSGPRMVMRRPGDATPPDMLTMMRRMNHNIDAAQRLAGNVGYLAVSELSGRAEEAYRVLDGALAFLERTDALIIDLRNTRGGSTRMSDYLLGYFLGDSVVTLKSSSRAMGETIERRTPKVNGTVRRDVPLYLLIGPGTASGAEDFAFALKTRGRATMVGTRTAGAGRLTALFPLGDGFVVSVSGGRTFDPATGAEWERVGIQPDSASPLEDALAAAHAAALTRVASAISDSGYRGALEWTRRVVLARAKPVRVDDKTLRRYAGTYDLRVITFERGKLWYQREASRPAEELTAVDDRTFAIGEATRVEFVASGDRVTAMLVTPPIGPQASIPRSRP